MISASCTTLGQGGVYTQPSLCQFSHVSNFHRLCSAVCLCNSGDDDDAVGISYFFPEIARLGYPPLTWLDRTTSFLCSSLPLLLPSVFCDRSCNQNHFENDCKIPHCMRARALAPSPRKARQQSTRAFSDRRTMH